MIATSTPVTTAATTANSDREVCAGQGGLEHRGKAFFPTYKSIMLANGVGVSAKPVELAAAFAVLTMVGATGGGIDGSAVVDRASPPVRLAVSRMVRDADRLAQHYADVTKGGLVANSDITPIITSFTEALIECTKAGYQPSWFKPEELGSR